jgi:rod shape determining protein RodA
MMARVMSDYSFNIKRLVDLVKVAAVILLPFMIIVLQNDTGSGLVLGAFIFVFFREGLSKYIYFPVIFTVFLFVVSLIFDPFVIFMVLLLLFMGYSMLKHGAIEGHVRMLCGILLATLLLSAFTPLSGYAALMIVASISVVVLLVFVFKTHTLSLLWPIVLFVYAMIFVPTSDYLFSKLEPHQQNRIHTFVGIVDDPTGVGFNVIQSEIAIGSGGFTGKGIFEGTQNRYDFVPEKHTDFIFSVVGEEWGMLGATLVVSLFVILILRLMRMGERIKEPFGRVYCYSVAAMLLLHLCVNVGMTIGLMPVMGIPLPLVSYGGSSLLAFTILIMIAIRLDASTSEKDDYMGI